MQVRFQPQSSNVILYRTHFWDEACAREFAALRLAAAGDYDLVVSGFLDGEACAGLPPDVPDFVVNMAQLQELDYPALPRLIPFQLDPIHFFRQYPGYANYWMIEYDVRYTGDWAQLLRELAASPADFLGTIVQSRTEHPAWTHWNNFSCAGNPPPEACFIKSFTPLIRLSAAALRAADAAYLAGWEGHYEALWPTAAAAAGLTIEEIGGEGAFTPPERYGKYYTSTRFDPYLTPGSFAFRPSILEADVPQSPPGLWHPVKSAAMYEPIPAPPKTWRDLAVLQPVRRLRGRLRAKPPAGAAPGIPALPVTQERHKTNTR
jgi:hypothetical protein